ncbi:MAG: hypothetical protein JSW10_09125, partial [Pseudomonadota bacterium]
MNLDEVHSGLNVYLHALSGSCATQVASGKAKSRQSALKRTVAGQRHWQDLVWQDNQEAHLPRRIARFASRELNRDLYYWLAAYLALEPDAPSDSSLPAGLLHLLQGMAVSARVLQRFPGLRDRYARLCTACLDERCQVAPEPAGPDGGRAALLESAFRYALDERTPPAHAWLAQAVDAARRGESPGKPPAEWRLGPIPFWPVVLWGHPVPPGIKVPEPIPEIVEPEGDEDKEQLWKADEAPQYREDAPEQVGGALESGVLYPEWNCRRGEYRDDWCRVHEQVPDAARGKRIPPELRALANRVRRRFEALRMQERWRRHLSDGEEVDIEAFIDALCERRGCGQSTDRLYRHRLRLDRDLSVAVLLDVSNSTHGWVGASRIIDIAQHAMVVLAEALDELQDDFALYAFSSLGRAFVDCWRIKGFHENYNAAVGERVLGLTPHGSTRMGAAVRHVGAALERRRSRHRLLLVLTDGRPYDPADRYLGRYALEDTRRALMDLHARGVAAFGLTIDREG